MPINVNGSDLPSAGLKRWLRRKIGWLLAFKAAALLLLWWLFFSPAHREPVDADVMTRHLAPAEPVAGRETESRTPKEDPDDV